MTLAIGSLVKARGREWVVLPESSEDLVMLRPLGGTDDEVTGIFLPLETVEPAQFALPDASDLGDHRSCRLLRDAIRLGFRSSAGPMRSFAQIAVEPRPYQLVPLLMALRLDPVRMLIADDVGVGKTVEACLVARELMDRGESQRLAVLCPPHLAEQWQEELREKFHIDAELVLASTATRLERNLMPGESLFDRHPCVVVSMDFIKSDRHREDFIRACPELVIVDEAHTCAFGSDGRRTGRQLRHELLKRIAADPDRHVILVTATPHSGKEEAFRSLLLFLNRDFAQLPDDLSGGQNAPHRRNLAQYFVQRRRADIRHYMDEDTPFPEREEAEDTYTLSPEYKKLFERVLDYARETVIEEETGSHRQRVRWWSALALLRSLASSPAAASATLRTRAATVDTDTPEEADDIGRRTVLDMDPDDLTESLDVAPGSDAEEDTDSGNRNRQRLLRLAREAEALFGKKDKKQAKACTLVKSLVKDGYNPIVFCRFIPTAEYLDEHLRKALPKKTEVAAVTGTLPPAERERRVLQLAEAESHVLICTDCLSEGINLQEHFDAVMHYDLSWNPTRHEQREGRVDRFGQPKSLVRVLTYFGEDNQIDGIVLDVLIRKHKNIRSSLGISVPVPMDTNKVVEALFEGLLLREQAGSVDQYLPGLEEYMRPQKEDLHEVWDNVADKERRSRTMFAQETIKVDEVSRELQAVREAIGSGSEVRRFVEAAVRGHRGLVTPADDNQVKIDLTEAPRALKDAAGQDETFEATFEPGEGGLTYLHRTHPLVEGLATYVTNTALDAVAEGIAKRTGVVRTGSVKKRTTLLLTRFRYHIVTKKGNKEHPLLAEDCQLTAFEGAPQNAVWLDSERAVELLDAAPKGNITPDQASTFISRIIEDFDALWPHINDKAEERGQELLDAHKRVRTAARIKGVSCRVEPKLPPDVMGIYMFLPAT